MRTHRISSHRALELEPSHLPATMTEANFFAIFYQSRPRAYLFSKESRIFRYEAISFLPFALASRAFKTGPMKLQDRIHSSIALFLLLYRKEILATSPHTRFRVSTTTVCPIKLALVLRLRRRFTLPRQIQLCDRKMEGHKISRKPRFENLKKIQNANP